MRSVKLPARHIYLSVTFPIPFAFWLFDDAPGEWGVFVMREFCVALLVGAVSVVALGGCATVTRGTTDQVQIQSNPPGADARTSMGHTSVTPCTLQFGRKDEFTVTIAKAGYHIAQVPVKSQVGGAGAAGFAGNVIVGGVVGMGVDAATGATLEHFPNPVIVDLIPIKKGEAQRTIEIVPAAKPVAPEELNPRT